MARGIIISSLGKTIGVPQKNVQVKGASHWDCLVPTLLMNNEMKNPGMKLCFNYNEFALNPLGFVSKS